MASNAELIETLLSEGRYSEIVDAMPGLPLRAQLPPNLRVALAHALYYCGAIDSAVGIAEHEDSPDAPLVTRSKCQVVIGLVKRRHANPEEAVRHFQTALQLAQEARDHQQTAWSAVHLFRMLAEMRPSETLLPLLREVRVQVIRAGNPHIAAYMHDSIAMMEASSGRLDEARRHFRISKALIEQNRNAWLEQLNLANSFYLAFLDCRYEDALQAVGLARRLNGAAGDHHRPLLDCNEGHALLALGRFDAAERRFKNVIAKELPLFVLGALEGLGRLYLATDRLDECEAVIKRFESQVSGKTGAGKAFDGRWIAATRLRLLMKRGRWDDAAMLAEQAKPDATNLVDGLASTTLACLNVEVLAGRNNVEKAIGALAGLSDAMPLSVPDHQANYYRAAGMLLRRADAPFSALLFERARAIWTTYKNQCALAELQHALSFTDLTTDARSNAATAVVTSVAAALSLANHPRLLARELRCAITALGCSPTVETLNSKALGARLAPINHVDLDLGEINGKPATLRCELPSDPTHAVLLNDILRIGRAAVDLERYRQEERDRAALWPADPVEEQGGALFVAEEMQALLATARRIAPTNVPVLITGETGTGKEVLARTIHTLSTRARSVFLPFNCTSTPRDMLDSQLFGHRRGSFTGATEHFQGVIRAAAGGTLFLDEIGDMSLEVQPKILRFLESGEVHPIGETQPQRTDARVIAATNVSLDTLVAQGRFREDLYYRLNIVRLHIPPLRERRVEIPTLAHYYLQKHAQEFRKGDLRLSEDTMEYLVLYRWPGNVRQLANEMRRLAALAETGAVLMPEHLSPEIAASRRTIPASERVLDANEVVVRLDQPMPAALQHLERAMLQYALKKSNGRMEDTAAMLGLSRKGLYLKRQRFGIEPPRESHTEVA